MKQGSIDALWSPGNKLSKKHLAKICQSIGNHKSIHSCTKKNFYVWPTATKNINCNLAGFVEESSAVSAKQCTVSQVLKTIAEIYELRYDFSYPTNLISREYYLFANVSRQSKLKIYSGNKASPLWGTRILPPMETIILAFSVSKKCYVTIPKYKL